jgi:pentatricopeptide repeat protein
MRAAGVDPNPNTARSILDKITANDDVNDVVAAYLILKGMCKRKKPVDVAAINAVIAGFVRLGDVKAAFGVYKDMPDFNARPDVSTFNTLLKGGADQGRKQFSMWVAAEMNEMGLRPDRYTYEHLFNVCVMQDDFTDAFTYLKEMKAMGFKPSAKVYNALGRRCRETGDGRFEAVLVEMEGCGYGIDELVMVELKDGEGYDESLRSVERIHHERTVL